ncbi:high affinity cationic amino acid transporter 1-like, partial [Argonauta hians]
EKMKIKSCLKNLIRLKTLKKDDLPVSDLARVLNLFDLILLSLGCTVGTGAYILTGEVARNVAGPSIVLSFIIAALTSLLAAFCYAEFGGRIPRAGSAYTYTYLTLGELTAFIVGWSLILEYAIGVASNVKALTTNFDSMINGTMSSYLKSVAPIKFHIFGEYPDFAAFFIVMVLTLILMCGVKESAVINNIATTINVLVLCYFIIAGLFHVDVKNWSIKNETAAQHTAGTGGFFPYSFSGTMAGAATCFYAFVGFDIISTTGEEARNPQKSIPLSILLSLLIVTLLYVGVSTVITLMCPYYLIDPLTPLPKVFDYIGWVQPKVIIYTGVVCALGTSIFSSLFPLPRIVYTMANDGIIFQCFSRVSSRFKTPWLAVLVCGFLAAVISTVFDLPQLIEMLSLATLLAYTLVSKSITILRYRRVILQTEPSPCPVDVDEDNGEDGYRPDLENSLLFSQESFGCKIYRWFNPNITEPNESTERIALVASVLLSLVLCVLFYITSFLEKSYPSWAIVMTSVLGLLAVLLLVVISNQPQNQEPVGFKVPLVPIMSEFSAVLNMYLVTKLSYSAWIRFAVWLFLGFLIYFSYGLRYSKEAPKANRLSPDDKDHPHQSQDQPSKLRDLSE